MLNTRVHQSEVSMATNTPRIPEQGVATLPDEAWNVCNTFAQEGIPREFLSHYIPSGPFAFLSMNDGLHDNI